METAERTGMAGGVGRRPGRVIRIALGLWAVVLAGLVGFYALVGYFDAGTTRFFPAAAPNRDIAAVLFSSDAGFRVGTSGKEAHALARAGVPVLGFNSPTLFARHQNRSALDAIVAGAIRRTLTQTGARRVVVVGGSFGADVARVGLADLPPGLRSRVAGAVLIVPGRWAYFRADPLGLAYLGAGDAGPGEARSLTWLPVVCIRGADESESLCDALAMPNVRRVTLPGGHFLSRARASLDRIVVAAAHQFGAASSAQMRSPALQPEDGARES